MICPISFGPAKLGSSGALRHFEPLLKFFSNSLRNGLSEEIGHLADAGRNETAFRPDKTYISDIRHKFSKDRNDIGMAEFVSKGSLGEQANTNTGQNGGPDRFDTVG